MNDRQTIKVPLFRIVGKETYDLAPFIVRLTQALLAAPADQRESVKIEFDVDYDDGGGTNASIDIYFERPENDEDIEQRRREVESAENYHHNWEIRQLKTLLDKHGLTVSDPSKLEPR